MSGWLKPPGLVSDPENEKGDKVSETMLNRQIARELTLVEAAQIAHLAPNTLRTWRAAGAGPPFERRNNRLVIAEDVLREWLRQNGRTAVARVPDLADRIAARLGDVSLCDEQRALLQSLLTADANAVGAA